MPTLDTSHPIRIRAFLRDVADVGDNGPSALPAGCRRLADEASEIEDFASPDPDQAITLSISEIAGLVRFAAIGDETIGLVYGPDVRSDYAAIIRSLKSLA